VEKRGDYTRPRNLVLASLVLVVGVSGAHVEIGEVSLRGMALATVASVVVSLAFAAFDRLGWSADCESVDRDPVPDAACASSGTDAGAGAPPTAGPSAGASPTFGSGSTHAQGAPPTAGPSAGASPAGASSPGASSPGACDASTSASAASKSDASPTASATAAPASARKPTRTDPS